MNHQKNDRRSTRGGRMGRLGAGKWVVGKEAGKGNGRRACGMLRPTEAHDDSFRYPLP